jgi:outer membrane biosynthesis protein TonB
MRFNVGVPLGFLAALLALTATAASAQSLGQLAGQEAERRRAITAPARVLTNDDLQPAPPLPSRPTAAQPVGEDAITSSKRVPLAPASFERGVLPRIPVEAVSGGEVLLELSVDSSGSVVNTVVLRDTAPFTEELIAAARRWQFTPAEDAAAPDAGMPVDRATSRPVDSQVLVIGLFRPPGLFPFTLGIPPLALGIPSEMAPALVRFPSMPAYPPQALFDGVVLTELRVGADGAVDEARVLRSVPGFDAPTLDVLRGLPFRPARVHGVPTTATVYVVTAFRQPIIQ